MHYWHSKPHEESLYMCFKRMRPSKMIKQTKTVALSKHFKRSCLFRPFRKKRRLGKTIKFSRSFKPLLTIKIIQIFLNIALMNSNFSQITVQLISSNKLQPVEVRKRKSQMITGPLPPFWNAIVFDFIDHFSVLLKVQWICPSLKMVKTCSFISSTVFF